MVAPAVWLLKRDIMSNKMPDSKIPDLETDHPMPDETCSNKSDTAADQARSETLSPAIGPDDSGLTFADLPAADTKRWVIRRKALVVAAVRGGLLTLDEACSRYRLSVEEFMSWQAAIEQHGVPGLRTTRLQQYRDGNEVKQ